MTKTELAEAVGVSRTTVYRWLEYRDCPPLQEDPEGCLAFCEQQKVESRGGGIIRDVPGAGDLKESKLRAETIIKWQQVADYEATMRTVMESDTWDEVADILAAYKSTLERVPVDDQTRDQLNEALAEAVERVEARRAEAGNVEKKMAELRQVVLQSTEPGNG